MTFWAVDGCLLPCLLSCFCLYCLIELLTVFFFSPSINLMKQLISSSNLFVMQVEMDVYTALKKVLSEGPGWGFRKVDS